ncbi:uncharacterized protein MAM_00682 [Metarhizium album ARSEF 1941]|uniref:Uncharacterized protein n=1 Tax=Metarhizium album (strain ARSEF 1941) TaxID=1081103 RepID=A0A0B2X8Q7_METAS|nr:uncharacterized protein MAM_00682 [Metarhizium album ARSEF 1941]KHO01681.1 hypothetical protein MAM_00682 [Metarhizium album ARSEF 1941]
MPSAQTMEEELQQSVMLSEDDEYDTADAGSQAPSAFTRARSHKNEAVNVSGSEDGELSDQDASGEELDQDASGEEDNDRMDQQIIVGSATPGDGEEYDEDAEGEDEFDEEVGRVKVNPVDSEEEELGSDDSDAQSAAGEEESDDEEDEEDEEGVWEEGDAGDEDEESDAVQSNACMFCKQDEENDPSEDFEAFLACTRCGENGKALPPGAKTRVSLSADWLVAHQQCARDAAAMTVTNSGFPDTVDGQPC